MLTGLSINKEADLSLILQRVTWYGPSPGTLGSISRIIFKPNGQVVLRLHAFIDDSPKWITEKGTYKLKGNSIIVRGKAPLGKQFTATGNLNAKGELLFSNEMPEELRRFTDEPDDCSA